MRPDSPIPPPRRNPPAGRDCDNHHSNVERAILLDLARSRDTGEMSLLLQKVVGCNQILLHNYQQGVRRDFECALKGCGKRFELRVIPNQVLYPKYCEAHRTEHRRRHFLAAGRTAPAHREEDLSPAFPASRLGPVPEP